MFNETQSRYTPYSTQEAYGLRCEVPLSHTEIRVTIEADNGKIGAALQHAPRVALDAVIAAEAVAFPAAIVLMAGAAATKGEYWLSAIYASTLPFYAFLAPFSAGKEIVKTGQRITSLLTHSK